VTVVVITHEMDVVRAIANRVAVLDDGRLVEVGSAFDVFSAPQADTTRRFVETALQDNSEPEDATRLRQTYQARLVSVQIGQNNHLGTVLTDAVRTWVAVLTIIVLVQVAQFLGNWLARKALRR